MDCYCEVIDSNIALRSRACALKLFSGLITKNTLNNRCQPRMKMNIGRIQHSKCTFDLESDAKESLENVARCFYHFYLAQYYELKVKYVVLLKCGLVKTIDLIDLSQATTKSTLVVCHYVNTHKGTI